MSALHIFTLCCIFGLYITLHAAGLRRPNYMWYNWRDRCFKATVASSDRYHPAIEKIAEFFQLCFKKCFHEKALYKPIKLASIKNPFRVYNAMSRLTIPIYPHESEPTTKKQNPIFRKPSATKKDPITLATVPSQEMYFIIIGLYHHIVIRGRILTNFYHYIFPCCAMVSRAKFRPI